MSRVRAMQDNTFWKLSLNEINSILFYQGAVNNISLPEEKKDRLEFYQVNNAYELLNVLLFPGFENEKARFMEENRKVDMVLLDHISELVDIYLDIYSAMCKFTMSYGERHLYTYRQDRINTYSYIQTGEIPSFVSTSLIKNVNPIFCKKAGVLLLEFLTDGDVVYLNMNEILGKLSIYPDEQEILFPPFLNVEYKEVQMTDEELQWRDLKGNPPEKKLLLKVKGDNARRVEKALELAEILQKEKMENVKKIFVKLMCNEEPDEEEKKGYLEWKEMLQRYLRYQFVIIKSKIRKSRYQVELKKERLLHELEEYKMCTNEKREEYDRKVKYFSVALSILQPLAVFLLAISFIPKIETLLKILSLLFTTMCTIIIGICQSLALQGKWQQRTVTFLKLDELERDIRYDYEIDEEEMKQYIQRFKQILTNDDAGCETNTNKVVKYLDTMFQSQKPIE